ncbi:histidine kinase [Desulfovibrio desulfuricans]|nr:histidine kinase [Desulfovibrio desulfuricans]
MAVSPDGPMSLYGVLAPQLPALVPAVLLACLGVCIVLIARLRRQVGAARHENDLLKAMRIASPVPLCVKDVHGRYLGCNHAFELLFGVREADILGGTAAVVLPQPLAAGESAAEENMARFGTSRQTFMSAYESPGGPALVLQVDCATWRDASGVHKGQVNAYADITPLKRAEAALHESEARNRMLVEEAPISIMSFDAAGHITFVNKWHLRVFCRHRVDAGFFIGRRLDALPGLARAGLCERVARVLHGEELAIREVYFPEFTGGHDGWASIRGVPIHRDGQIVGGILIREDITERKRMEEVLRQREALVSSMLRNLPIDFWAADGEGRMLMQSDESVRVWGHLPSGVEPLTGSPLQWRNSDRFEPRVFAGETVEREIDVALPSGQMRTFNVIAAPVRLQGGITAMLRVNLDVTERKRVLAELRTARDAAEAANKAKSEFLAHMSHELRTPLNGVMGMLQLLDEHVAAPQGRAWLDVALESSRALLRILSDILDLSRIEAGRLDLMQEPFTPESVLAPVLVSLHRTVEGRAVRIVNEMDDSMPPVLVGDPGRIRQVLLNLLGNAAKYTERGEVRVGMRVLRRNGKALRVHLHVTDTGVGIADEQLQRALEPFGRLRQGSGLPRGVGLGLPIVVRLVRLMGGTLCIASEQGVGTEVHVTLPLLEANAGAVPVAPDVDEAGGICSFAAFRCAGVVPEADRLAPGEAPSPAVRHVLLVEDDPVNLMAARRMLERLECKVTTATCGQEALNALRSSVFDAVFMDIQMPDFDGIEALRRMRAKGSGVLRPQTPVVAMTAFAMKGDRERFMTEGMADYVSKPVLISALKDVLERLAVTSPGTSRT